MRFCPSQSQFAHPTNSAAAARGRHRTVNSRRDARCGPVGYCSSSTLGSRNGSMSCAARAFRPGCHASFWCPRARVAGMHAQRAPAFSGAKLANRAEKRWGTCISACSSLSFILPRVQRARAQPPPQRGGAPRAVLRVRARRWDRWRDARVPRVQALVGGGAWSAGAPGQRGRRPALPRCRRVRGGPAPLAAPAAHAQGALSSEVQRMPLMRGRALLGMCGEGWGDGLLVRDNVFAGAADRTLSLRDLLGFRTRVSAA